MKVRIIFMAYYYELNFNEEWCMLIEFWIHDSNGTYAKYTSNYVLIWKLLFRKIQPLIDILTKYTFSLFCSFWIIYIKNMYSKENESKYCQPVYQTVQAIPLSGSFNDGGPTIVVVLQILRQI